jgi:SSS family solute:Na+ symporter
MIATVMSTVDSYGFIAATTIGRDFVWRLRREVSEERVPDYSRAGLWIATAFACALALLQQSVIELWRNIGSVITPALLLPAGTAVLGRGRIGPRWTLTAMILAFAVSLFWVLAGTVALPGRPAAYPWSLQPIYAGLATSLAVYVAGWAFRRESPS